jgi:hypothetical protein
LFWSEVINLVDGKLNGLLLFVGIKVVDEEIGEFSNIIDKVVHALN